MDATAKRELVSHVREHVTYPATKNTLVEACTHMAHVPEATRQWAIDKLPDKRYNSADEVLRALEL
jgi:hypothetical protein